MARSTLARRLGAATLLTTLALTTAACGNDSGAATSSGADTSGSSESSEDSAGELEELEAAEFYPTVMAALQEAGTFAFTMRTSTDGNDAGSMSMEGVMRYDEQGVDLQATGSGAGSDQLEMVVLDQVLYLTGLGMEQDGKKWLRIDMSDPHGLFGMLGKATDPETMFKAMEEPRELELLGTEEVDGVATHHYKVVMDTGAYAKAMGLPAQLTSALPEDVGVEMWVDADNLPRKFHQELEVSAPAGGQTSTSTTEGTYSDFGTDVTIEAPPASEVSDDMGLGSMG